MKTISVVAALSALLVNATGAFAQSGDDALRERGAATIRAFQDTVITYAADFSQTLYDADGKLKDNATGVVTIHRPGKFAWIYQDPYEQHLIADGKNLWTWDVDLDSASVREQSGVLGQSPAQILSGDVDALEAFDYHGASEQEGVLAVQLGGRDQQSDFRVIRLAFEDNVLIGMRIGDSLGRTTDIEFSDIRINTEIDMSTFTFTAPDGVDVVGTPVSGERSPEVPVEADDNDASATAVISGLGG